MTKCEKGKGESREGSAKEFVQQGRAGKDEKERGCPINKR